MKQLSRQNRAVLAFFNICPAFLQKTLRYRWTIACFCPSRFFILPLHYLPFHSPTFYFLVFFVMSDQDSSKMRVSERNETCFNCRTEAVSHLQNAKTQKHKITKTQKHKITKERFSERIPKLI